MPLFCKFCHAVINSEKDRAEHERCEHWSLVLVRSDLAGQCKVYQVDRPEDDVFVCPHPACSWPGSIDPAELVDHVGSCSLIAHATDRTGFFWQPVEDVLFNRNGTPIQPKLVVEEDEPEAELSAGPSRPTGTGKGEGKKADASSEADSQRCDECGETCASTEKLRYHERSWHWTHYQAIFDGVVFEIYRSDSGFFECTGAGCNKRERNPYSFTKHARRCRLFKSTPRAAIPWAVVEGTFKANGHLLQPCTSSDRRQKEGRVAARPKPGRKIVIAVEDDSASGSESSDDEPLASVRPRQIKHYAPPSASPSTSAPPTASSRGHALAACVSTTSAVQRSPPLDPLARSDFHRRDKPASQPKPDAHIKAHPDLSTAPSLSQATARLSYSGSTKSSSAGKLTAPTDPRIRPRDLTSPMQPPTLPPPTLPPPPAPLEAPQPALASVVPGWSLKAPIKRPASAVERASPSVEQPDKRSKVDVGSSAPPPTTSRSLPPADGSRARPTDPLERPPSVETNRSRRETATTYPLSAAPPSYDPWAPAPRHNVPLKNPTPSAAHPWPHATDCRASSGWPRHDSFDPHGSPSTTLSRSSFGGASRPWPWGR